MRITVRLGACGEILQIEVSTGAIILVAEIKTSAATTVPSVVTVSAATSVFGGVNGVRGVCDLGGTCGVSGVGEACGPRVESGIQPATWSCLTGTEKHHQELHYSGQCSTLSISSDGQSSGRGVL